MNYLKFKWKYLVFTSLFVLLMAYYAPVTAQELELLSTIEFADIDIQGIDVRDGYAYLTSFDGLECDTILRIIDVSNPYSPVLISTADTTNPNYGHDIIADKGYAYIADGRQSLQIFDVASPDNPEPVAIVPLPDVAHSLFIEDGLVYIANCSVGLTIINVSTPTDPFIVSQYDGYYDGYYLDSFEGVYVVYPYAYIVGLQTDFIVINIVDPYNPSIASHCESHHFRYYDIVTAGNYAFTSLTWGYIEIFDISNPTAPCYIGSIELDGFLRRLFIYGEYLFAASTGSLVVFDISDPSMPTFIVQADDICYYDVVVLDGLVYTCGMNYFKIYSFDLTGINNTNNYFEQPLKMFANHPNPFNASTTISFTIDQPSQVKLSIYDITGRLVETPADEFYQAGNHSIDWRAEGLASGIYFAILSTGEITNGRKLLLLK